MTSEQKLHIGNLLNGYADNRSQEALISLVAEKSGMLTICRSVLKEVYANKNGMRDWMKDECKSRKIDLQLFLHDLAAVIEIFSLDKGEDRRYALLGIPGGSSEETIKKAYRRLSKKYHPDSSENTHSNDPDKFIEITKAYKELLEKESSRGRLEDIRPDAGTAARADTVNRTATSGNSKQPKHKSAWFQSVGLNAFLPSHKMYLWSLGCVLGLAIILGSISLMHKKRMMIAGLQQSRGEVTVSTEVIEIVPEKQSDQVVVGEVMDTIQEETAEETELIEEPAHIALVDDKPEAVVEEIQFDIEEPVLVAKEQVPVSIHRDVQKRIIASESSAEKFKSDVEKVDKKVKKNLSLQPAAKGDSGAMQSEQPVEKALHHIDWTIPPSTNKILLQTALVASTQQTDVAPVTIDLQTRVKNFLQDYIYAYEQRDLDLFSSFFLDDASENGRPFSETQAAYVKLFSVTSDLSLKIVDTISQEDNEGVAVVGRFKVYWHYNDSGVMYGKGIISMRLAEQYGKLRVKQIDYTFDE